MGYGKTLQHIRKSLLITQKELSEGIMSQSNYSKVESDEIDVPFSKMVRILNRLNMTFDEFIYIHQGYTTVASNSLKQLYKLDFNNRVELSAYYNELLNQTHLTNLEKEVCIVIEALILIGEGDFEAARNKSRLIWERLAKHDTWYLSDIELLNTILFIFEIETAGFIVDLAIKRLQMYKSFKPINGLVANLKLNYLLLLIRADKFDEALSVSNEMVTFCQSNNLYRQLALANIRRGIVKAELKKEGAEDDYRIGFDILSIMDNNQIITDLYKEIEYLATP